MSNEKTRLVIEPSVAPEYFATRLAHVDQCDGVVRLAFSSPSYNFDGEDRRVYDCITVKLIVPLSEIVRLQRMLNEPVRAESEAPVSPANLTLN